MYTKSSWEFSEEVSQQFDSHVRKSIPFYEQIQETVTAISDYYVSNNGLIYDLGCSTGETIRLLEERHPNKCLRFIGIDQSPSMIEFAKLKTQQNSRISWISQPLQDYKFEEKSRFIISVLTLQFLPIHERRSLIQRVFDALHPGGAFVLVEKTVTSSSIFQDIFTHLYYNLKLNSGLSPTEVLKKEESLRGVMMPVSVNDNMKLLEDVGFQAEIFLKQLQFTGFLAIKPSVL